jgi:peptidoglycan hydrolase CwlO-like protein
MTHGDMERSIEFILQQQAKSEAKFEEWNARFQRSLDSLLQQQAKTSSEVARLAAFGGELAKGQVRLQNKMAELAESHRRLAEAQSKTEEELKAFVAAMNRRFGSNGRGRKSA